MATTVPVTLDTLIIVKIQFRGQTKKFKLPLKDLGANVLPSKLRMLLQIHPDNEVIFERYSDSAGSYVTLDSDKPQVYKTLFRAAKAKLKLRLRASVVGEESEVVQAPPPPATQEPEVSSLHRMSTDTLYPSIVHTVPIPRERAASPRPSSYQKPVEVVGPAKASPMSPLRSNKADEGEAPVPQPFPARENLVYRPKESSSQCSWVVFCNHCKKPMEDEHFHCSICDHGDYDLCPTCVDAGIHCPGSGHWMVKRFVQNGSVLNSTTERVPPKKPQVGHEMPGAFTEEKPPHVYEVEEPTRTCNCCVKVLPEKEFVTCTVCEDYDLCVECHVNNKHGHHPGHTFKAATPETSLPALANILCNAGRNVRHSAVCDGCEKFIYGVRHKCLNCPDWDFCSECIKSAKFIHPRHRFVPIYEPLAEPIITGNRHYGIYCDGPLCKDKENLSYIEGVRYKCAVCHDTDFCANCEASPSNRHNHTHPLIKFKTPVRSVSVTTMGEDKNGVPIPRLGDQPARKSTATETTPIATSTNAATQVQTVFDQKPSDEPQPEVKTEKIEVRNLLNEPIAIPVLETPITQCFSSSPTIRQAELKPVKSEPISIPKSESSPSSSGDLDAHFIRDTITDGTKVFAGLPFVQVWTLRNPGPNAWPAGCSVRHVGGDNMLNIDNSRPLSQSELAEASESNVIGRQVEQDEEIAFRVIMKAPMREGTAISYWRLKTADGTPFGHRLWCDIQVISPPSPVTIPSPQPTTAPAVAEASTASSASSSGLNMTPYERSQQAKLERFRSLQLKAQVQTLKSRQPVDDVVGRSSRLQEEALERLRKMKLHLDEKEHRTRVAEKIEQEKMARIQKVRKAAVERLLETRRQQSEAMAKLRETSGSKLANEQFFKGYPETHSNSQIEQFIRSENIGKEPSKQETAQAPAQETPVEEIPTPAQPESSGMIFPQLEKESPASSTHEAVDVTPESKEPKSDGPTVAAPSEDCDDDFFEDAESVEICSVSSGDQGFLTDEEYDILDASDEDMP
ncbi:hypothetical protein CC78DRAFT_532810 [Lojkania enalia]|uniref:ZZ-type domain-containing protein n=1 Tax=Lojkania enalia TaxID=147567 RepID=A0A9P4N4M2_9PLEO|nr:hypothetical protein CC78DRAFT_532810 [Didymosphaeria enalia]